MAQQALRERQQAQELKPRKPPALPNRKSAYKTVEEEQRARQEVVTATLQVMRAKLPILLRRLEQIHDFRNPKKLRHKLTVLMIWGILLFVSQLASRRQANRQLTRPQLLENLRLFFPELESCPHQDTLNRLLAGIDVDQIEAAHVELVQRLIRKKKFYRYLIQNCYPIAFDGTQKHRGSELLDEKWQERQVGKEGEKETQYYVYVLEASLAFQNGMVLPLLSEFLDYTEGDTSQNKQDCELKAFYRLAARLKRLFPRLSILVLGDGLFANGPVMELCRKNNWDFMIVLKDGSLPSVWEEVHGLRELQEKNQLDRTWGERRQHFWWVNDIEYRHGTNQRKRQQVHVVVCEESWEEIDKKTNEEVTKTARHVWLSAKPLCHRNVHERCNLGARHRWGIEEGFLVEKCHGYHYEHIFSHNWNAMRGYHYLMRIGHTLNVLAQHATALIGSVKTLGVRGFIRFVWETMAGPWLNAEQVREALATPYQFRLA
ncbi:MAG: transposase family protein [bacterium]|nr:transposase family protein [bacterium]